MTAHELFEASTDFAALLKQWDVDRCCPYPLPDLLTECDLPGPAAFAAWAVERPDCEVFAPVTGYGERSGVCGPYPTLGWHRERRDRTSAESGLFWFWCAYTAPTKDFDQPHVLPASYLPADALGSLFGGSTPLLALLYVMDIWRPA